MVDNFFNICTSLLPELGEDNFYFVQVIQRKNKGFDHTKFIKSFSIYNADDLWDKKSEIIKVCQDYNARAYMYINPRNSKDISFHMIELITESLRNENYKNSHIYEIACGKFRDTKLPNKWILDIDTKDENDLRQYKDIVEQCDSGFDNNIIATIPTVHGYHLITHTFNVAQFRELTKGDDMKIEIQKDNPTLLYALDD